MTLMQLTLRGLIAVTGMLNWTPGPHPGLDRLPTGSRTKAAPAVGETFVAGVGKLPMAMSGRWQQNLSGSALWPSV